MIIPVYNAGAYLRPAIESVLAQTYCQLEIIVIDDGSTDGCVEAVRDLRDERIVWMHQSNQGKPAAMNRAIAAARGDYYAVNDADDISYPSRVEEQVRCLQENSDVAGVFSGHELLIGERRLAPRRRSKSREVCAANIAAYRMPAHDPTAMYRLSMVRGLEYDVSLAQGEGLDYILRVGERWPLLVLGDTLYGYHVHPESLTRGDPSRREALVRQALLKAAARRGSEDVAALSSLGIKRSYNCRRDNGLATHCMESAVDLRREGSIVEALRTGLACAAMHPLDPEYYRALVCAVLPTGMAERLRRWVGRSARLAGLGST